MGLTTEPTIDEDERPPDRWPFAFNASRYNPWRGLGGLPREIWLLFATNLINRAGMMVLPFLTIYLTRGLHFSAARSGFVFAVYGATAIIAGPVAGKLSDRIGALPIMRASLISSGTALLFFPLARTFESVVVVTALWAACAEIFRPASLAAIAHVVSPAQQKPAFALYRLAVNLGMSIGPALGGFLATVSFHAMFVVDAGTSLVAGAVLSLATWTASTGGDNRSAPLNETQSVNEVSSVLPIPRVGVDSVFQDARFGVFLVASVVVGIVFYQHESALPLYMVQFLHMSPAFYGTLFTVNTIIIVAIEVPLNTLTARWPTTWSLVAGSALFAIGFGALALVSTAPGVLGLVVVWTFGEMMLFPAMAAHVTGVAPVSRRGTYMGAYSMSLSVALTLGPWLGAQLLGSGGPKEVWSVMFALGALGAILMVYAAPPHRRRRSLAAAGS
ncbi:MAG TPA: MFS transporter [Gemmatimonadaceae bacterium]|nr:MFS transporter [Gemmatimonadaceae bacterium]